MTASNKQVPFASAQFRARYLCKLPSRARRSDCVECAAMWRPITPMSAEKEVSIFRETVSRGSPKGRVVWQKHHMW
jgi:hypothetical protein